MFDRLALLNAVDRSEVFPLTAPRDAVSVILVDRRSSPYQLLMGRRPQSDAFMPAVTLFPGGAIEPEDHVLASRHGHVDKTVLSSLDALLPHEPLPKVSRSQDCSPEDCSPEDEGHDAPLCGAVLLSCGLRELQEETGLRLWDLETPVSHASPIRNVVYLARALTPPGRRKRFDTRFLCIDVVSHDLSPLTDTAELQQVRWVSYEQAVTLPLHAMTRVILEDVHDLLTAQTPLKDQPQSHTKTHCKTTKTQRVRASLPLSQPAEVPFYQMVHGQFQCEWLEMKSRP